jgi:hypothetical protein
MTESSWGHPGRHYAVPLMAAHKFTDGMVFERPRNASLPAATRERWAELLEKARPGVRETVGRTYRQWNNILRDYVRIETGLRLTVGDDAQAVPVKIDGGMPVPFVDILRRFEGLEWLVLNRPMLANAAAGVSFLDANYLNVHGLFQHPPIPAGPEAVAQVRHTLDAVIKKLDELKAVDQIVGINEDVLGAYFFLIPEVRLYWMVIGIVATALGVSLEALTVVVLTHELAHAYTHLGRDIDSEQWDREDFAAADLDIVEGLAQFYTQVICQRLQYRMPAAMEAYQALLEKQSEPYRAHEKWVGNGERAGEIVRVSMIECRSRRIRSVEDFSAAIKRHREQTKGRKAVDARKELVND